MEEEQLCPANHGARHHWQVVAIPITVQDMGLTPKLIIQFFRSCPWCKTSEDMPGRQMAMGQPNKAILS